MTLMGTFDRFQAHNKTFIPAVIGVKKSKRVLLHSIHSSHSPAAFCCVLVYLHNYWLEVCCSVGDSCCICAQSVYWAAHWTPYIVWILIWPVSSLNCGCSPVFHTAPMIKSVIIKSRLCRWERDQIFVVLVTPSLKWDVINRETRCVKTGSSF